jgi:hypothetical protein
MFSSEKPPERRGGYRRPKNTGHSLAATDVHRRMAVRKLEAVYGIYRKRWSWEQVAVDVARALNVALPEKVSDRTSMIMAFGNPKQGPAVPVGEDRVALLLARRPFRPLTISPQMEEALRRTREFRELGGSYLGTKR